MDEDDSIPEPILNLRKKSAATHMRNFDSSGEERANNSSGEERANNDRKRPHEENGNGENVSKLLCQEVGVASNEDPPARERPADGNWPQRESLSFTRSLVFYGNGSITPEHETAAKYIEEARALRKKYFMGDGVKCQLSKENGKSNKYEYVFSSTGVCEIYDASDFRRTNNLITVPSLESFVKDYQRLVEISSSGAMRSFSFQRLQLLDSAFKMHTTINGSAEDEAQSGLLGTDFYRTMKVDNHIHLAAAASAKQFVNFVRDKLENEGDTVVMEDGQTLKEVFSAAGLDSEHLTIDAFNVLADYSVYQRFDNFNSKYSPFRMAQMRKIFLKTDNHIEGRYFAELTKIVLARHEQGKGHSSGAEMRLSIYGMERKEWLQLAKWVLRDWKTGDFPGNMLSSHNRWLVQVPRLWRVYHKKGKGTVSFQDMLENLFGPLFEATLFPDKHPEVAELLKHIVGFDSVDDEGSLEVGSMICSHVLVSFVFCSSHPHCLTSKQAPLSCCLPSVWKREDNPAYCWQLYYLWANIEVLNKLRQTKGLNTFAFRPHAGETGDSMHLAATYMLCRSINHGINLDKQVSLQYLYYLDQVGLSVSPLSNNFLFRKIKSNPFPKLFKRGMNVALSTDDPLLFHMSDDALLEEFSVARASFDLSMTDISEIARNSVLQSGFEDHLKAEWLGENYKKGVTHCDENKTHVPLIRAKFRAEHLALEHSMVLLLARGKGKTVLKDMMHTFGEARNANRSILFENMTDVPSFPEQNQL